jgi:hypothetical protein
MATRHGNPMRISTLPYGDTPTGEYRVIRVAPSGSGTEFPEASFGPHGVLELEGTLGAAALAEANGRFVIMVQGGEPGSGNALRATNGAIRLSSESMRELLVALGAQAVGTLCRCTESAFEDWPLEAAEPPVDIAFDCLDGDAVATIPAGGEQSQAIAIPWITPKYVRATVMAVVAHGEYDSGPGDGMHTENIDGMSVQVHDGFHLERGQNGSLNEVPDTPQHDPGLQQPDPQPQQPDPQPQQPDPDPQSVFPDPHGHELIPIPTPVPTPIPTPSLSPAQSLLDNAAVDEADSHTSGVNDNATALDNLQQSAAGQAIQRSHYGNAPGGTTPALNPNMLAALQTLAQHFSYNISELAGGTHSPTSQHYNGNAVDINVINGAGVSASNPDVPAFEQMCRDLGATVVLGPGTRNHDTHIHCQWP